MKSSKVSIPTLYAIEFSWTFWLKSSIMSSNNDLEIRSLDSELQTLVYENYNKFISATDIIKNVWSMSNLSGSIDQEKHGWNWQWTGQLKVESFSDQWLICWDWQYSEVQVERN